MPNGSSSTNRPPESTAARPPAPNRQWDLSAAEGSWLTIAVQLGFVVGALVSAVLNLADLVPPRRLMLVGAVGAAVTNLCLLLATGAASAIPLRFVTGVFLAGCTPRG